MRDTDLLHELAKKADSAQLVWNEAIARNAGFVVIDWLYEFYREAQGKFDDMIRQMERERGK